MMGKIAAVLAFLLTANIALAHSPLERTVPADGAGLTDVPAEVALVFARDIRLTRVEWTLDDDQSGSIDLSATSGFATEFTLPFDGAGSGEYRIEWRGLGDDGHPQTGSFGFVVE